MPSAAPSFLLLRFLCRYKENEIAVGQPDGFALVFEFKSSSKEGNRLTICCPRYHEVSLNFVSSL